MSKLIQEALAMTSALLGPGVTFTKAEVVAKSMEELGRPSCNLADTGYVMAEPLSNEWKVPITEIKFPDNSLAFKVFSVDGNYVRTKYSVDFVEGGHDLRYDFIPEKEIWVEKMESWHDMSYNLAHEVIEYVFMRWSKYQYEPAHRVTADIEQMLRQVAVGLPVKKPE